MTRPAALILACVLGGSAAHAAAPAPPGNITVYIPPEALKQPSDAAGAGLASVFGAMCLQNRAFPGHGDPPASMTGPGTRLEPLTADQVRQLLGADPGRGWRYTGAEGTFILTIEDPPYHACAVRGRFPAMPGYVGPYQILARTWASSIGRPVTNDLGPITQRQGAAISVARQMDVPAARGAPAEHLIDIAVRDPDGHVNIRLVRQIPDASVSR